jgi:crotonobetainyl-CoA:carnitine CoA-transferase CaiB-like acyl-CoA transferase
VTTSLLRAGAYVLSFDLMINLHGDETVPYRRPNLPNPIMNCYRTEDDKWLWLLCLQADRHWPDVVRAIDRPDFLEDDRFATTASRSEHRAELFKLFEEVFEARTLTAWADALDREGVWWSPVQATHDLLHDPQAGPAGVFIDVPTASGHARMVSTPLDFSGTAWAPAAMSPEIGQHTEEVLLELGYDWEQIGSLATEGVIP